MPSGFGDESEQEVKEAVKPTGNRYTWEELAKYNERHKVHVAVRGKVSQLTLSSDYIRFYPKQYVTDFIHVMTDTHNMHVVRGLK